MGGETSTENRENHTMGGVIIAILEIIDFPGLGAFGIGSLLGYIGAMLALVYKPAMAPSMMPGQPMGSMPMGSIGSMGSMGTGAATGQMGMTCKNCGASIPAGATRCPSCGASVM